MDELLKNTNDMTFRIGKMVGAILTLTVFLSVSACATVTSNKELKPIDKVTIGIEDKEMRELWIKADNEGRLPPIEQIPIPDKRMTRRHVTTVGEIDIPKPVRPLIHEKVIADIQPFSLKTINQYKGDFQIITNKPGVLIGKISDYDNPLEFHYKLPIKSNTVHLPRDSTLQLIFRDDVQDSALQRRIVLSDKGNIAPFVYISEGSNEPYIEVIKEIGLTIEQEKERGNPTYQSPHIRTMLWL